MLGRIPVPRGGESEHDFILSFSGNRESEQGPTGWTTVRILPSNARFGSDIPGNPPLPHYDGDGDMNGDRQELLRPTCHCAIVCNKGCHVHSAAIDVQISHAANEVLVRHGEVLGKVGDTPQEQRACQVQGPGGQELGLLVGLEPE